MSIIKFLPPPGSGAQERALDRNGPPSNVDRVSKQPSKRVLVVEDNQNVRDSLIDLLSQEELEVDGAADGEEALRMMAEHPYDAVTLDLAMPVLDGWAVLEEMRHQDIDVPVLVVTARQGTEESARALGAKDVLAKPFGPEVVLKRIMRLLDGAEDPDAPEAQDGVEDDRAAAPRRPVPHLRAV